MKHAARLAVVTVAALLVAGCNAALVRLEAAGAYDEVIERAQSRRWPPRRKGARAYARALVATQEVERARGVLLRDFRRGGQIPSLVALADLEANRGLWGTAAHHYARVVSLDSKALRGRIGVCRLLTRRARALLELGEALAAEGDLQRAYRICDAGSYRPSEIAEQGRLAEAIDTAADEQTRARVASTRCARATAGAPCTERSASSRIALTHERLVDAAAKGAPALLAAARRAGAQVDPAGLVAILLADLRGELGPHVMIDDTVRALVGAQRWGDVGQAVLKFPPPEAAYVQLRLSAVMPDLPIAPPPRIGPSQLDRWADRSAEVKGAREWRVFALRGALPSTELALASVHRPAPGTVDTSAGAGPKHWSARVVVTADNIAELLVVARLRAAAGSQDLALALARHVLARAQSSKLAPATVLARDEALRAIAGGQPWHALALVDAAPNAQLRPVAAAAAAAIALSRAFCGGDCRDDEDRATVTRVMGQAWVDGQLVRLRETSRADRGVAGVDACPTLAELLSEDAQGPVPAALKAARAGLQRPGVSDALRVAVEADLAQVCVSRYVLPLMAAAGTRLGAAQAGEMLAHVPEAVGAGQIETQVRLALVAGEPQRGELLSIGAAAASRDPGATWFRIAAFAAMTKARDVEVLALSEAVAHARELDHEPARRALVFTALQDLGRSWGAGKTEVGREAVARDVEEYLAAYAPEQRWSRREALAWTVVGAPWLDEPLRGPVTEALFPPDVREQHGAAAAAVAGEPTPPAGGPFDIAGGARELSATGAGARKPAGIPQAPMIFAAPTALEPARLAVAHGARDWTARWRTAVGLAVFGSPRARAQAVRELIAMLEDDAERRRAIEAWLLASPAAIAVTDDGAQATTAVADPLALLGLVFGLDLAPSWYAG